LQAHLKTAQAIAQTKVFKRACKADPKGGVPCSTDSFVVNQTSVFQIKFCGKSPALRVAAFRYAHCSVIRPKNISFDKFAIIRQITYL
jgi:hypothetical protein